MSGVAEQKPDNTYVRISALQREIRNQVSEQRAGLLDNDVYLSYSIVYLYGDVEDLPLSAVGDFIQHVPQLKAISSVPSWGLVTRWKQRIIMHGLYQLQQLLNWRTDVIRRLCEWCGKSEERRNHRMCEDTISASAWKEWGKAIRNLRQARSCAARDSNPVPTALILDVTRYVWCIAGVCLVTLSFLCFRIKYHIRTINIVYCQSPHNKKLYV